MQQRAARENVEVMSLHMQEGAGAVPGTRGWLHLGTQMWVIDRAAGHAETAAGEQNVGSQ